ncbi:MAG: hypothetical protein EBY16_05020 [Gammaproteobacteria bacterium]|nr:hypothetical protein [Gammaproteobacteria bacterium]
MLNALLCMLDLKLHLPTPPDLKEELKLIDRKKDRLYIYRMSLADNPFTEDSLAQITKSMSVLIGSETNLSPYALYIVWGRSLYVCNLTKEKNVLKLTKATQIYLEPLTRPEFLEYCYQLTFNMLEEFPLQWREKLSLSHVHEAHPYNEKVKRLVAKLYTIEHYLIRSYGIEQYFTKHDIQHFMFGVAESSSPGNSPKRAARTPSPFMDTPPPQAHEAQFRVDPCISKLHGLPDSVNLKQAEPVSPHVFFIHFWEINHHTMKIYEFIQSQRIYPVLLEKYALEFRKLFLRRAAAKDLSHDAAAAQALFELGIDACSISLDRQFLPICNASAHVLSLDASHRSSFRELSENDDLLFEILNKFSLTDMWEHIQRFSLKECEMLLKAHPSSEAAAKLYYALVCQRQLDLSLQDFSFDNQLKSHTDRMILTTAGVIHGLNFIKQIFQFNGIDHCHYRNLKGINIRDLLVPPGIKLAAIEVAWGTLDACMKNPVQPYILCSEELTEFYACKLEHTTTLVLDGHGGIEDIRIGTSSVSSTKLCHLTKKILAADVSGHIKHLILQSCFIGQFNPPKTPHYIKNIAKASGKQKIIIVDKPVQLTKKGQASVEFCDFFKKEDKENAPIHLAKAIIDAIFQANRQVWMAFTFSPALINPSSILGNGNLGVSPQAQAERSSSPQEWCAKIPDECFTFKSVTLIWNPDHPKLQRSLLRDEANPSTYSLYSKEDRLWTKRHSSADDQYEFDTKYGLIIRP